jgi:hypothetical protein
LIQRSRRLIKSAFLRRIWMTFRSIEVLRRKPQI